MRRVFQFVEIMAGAHVRNRRYKVEELLLDGRIEDAGIRRRSRGVGIDIK